jgi:mono/diheme cytochrome c family protein
MTQQQQPLNDLPRRNPLAELRLRRPPFWMVAAFLILIVLTWIPLVVAARRRVSTSEDPRILLPQDMGQQPKYKAQHENPIFADHRADRPPVFGTVSRENLGNDDHYYRGYTMAPPAAGTTRPTVTFFKGFPRQVKVTEALLHRGQERFNIYCSACHGVDGHGHGPVNDRAVELQEPKWVQAADLHSETVKNRPDGHIFNTITNGIRNMPGYAAQVPIHDRWAIVAYVRALQLSQDQPPSSVPADKLSMLK